MAIEGYRLEACHFLIQIPLSALMISVNQILSSCNCCYKDIGEEKFTMSLTETGTTVQSSFPSSPSDFIKHSMRTK